MSRHRVNSFLAPLLFYFGAVRWRSPRRRYSIFIVAALWLGSSRRGHSSFVADLLIRSDVDSLRLCSYGPGAPSRTYFSISGRYGALSPRRRAHIFIVVALWPGSRRRVGS